MKLFIRAFVMASSAVFLTSGFLRAAEPEKNNNEVNLYAELAGVGSQAAAKGYVRNYSVTFPSTSTRQSHSRLAISVRYLKLGRGSTVTFQLNGTTIGSAVVTAYHRAHLLLLTENGNTVPTINAGDTLTVIDPNGTTVDLTGTFVTAPDLE
jgi:hypothetical protein